MIVLIHVLIALTSLVFTALTYIKPTKNKLTTSYVLVASTLMSGVYLVFANQANILRLCMSGLVFITITTFITWQARLKLDKNVEAISVKAE